MRLRVKRALCWTIRSPLGVYIVLLLLVAATVVGSLWSHLLLLPGDQQYRSDTRDPMPIQEGESADQLIEDLRDHYLMPPASAPYNLDRPNMRDPAQYGQPTIILGILQQLRGGFFVECGAGNGERFSNTLYMERFLGWKGLLIEPNPSEFAELSTKQRKAWSINGCLNDQKRKTTMKITIQRGLSHIIPVGGRAPEGTALVDCFPLEVILSALGRTRVDYFSLDVEGQELGLLNSIPFDQLDIRTLSVETNHSPLGRRAIVNLMRSKGYTEVKFSKIDSFLVKDSAFPDLVQKAGH